MKPMIPWFEVPIFDVGGFEIHGFGILVALGFWLGGEVAMRRASRIGLDREAINRLIGWLVLGTFVGGHFGYGLMYAPEKYLSNPVLFLDPRQGLSSMGGFLVCVPLAIWFFKKENLPLWPNLDNLAIGLTLGWALGRTGCFVAHDHPGTPTDFYLGVYGICPGFGKDVACHDMGLYEAIWSYVMFGLFLLLDRKPRFPGFYPLVLGAVYAPLRFGMDYLRPESTDVRYLGLTPAQYLNILLGVICLAALARRARSNDAPVWKP